MVVPFTETGAGEVLLFFFPFFEGMFIWLWGRAEMVSSVVDVWNLRCRQHTEVEKTFGYVVLECRGELEAGEINVEFTAYIL